MRKLTKTLLNDIAKSIRAEKPTHTRKVEVIDVDNDVIVRIDIKGAEYLISIYSSLRNSFNHLTEHDSNAMVERVVRTYLGV